MQNKKTRILHLHSNQGEELPGLQCKFSNKMTYNQDFFEKVFSHKRMERYYSIYPDNFDKAIQHYACNLRLSEAMYIPLSVFEVTLRNAICRELTAHTGREDWFVIFPNTPGLSNLNRYITQATKQISGRHETATVSKIIAELTLGFWVSLFNSEYERVLWKALRRAFPHMPKTQRKRKNISSPLNRLRNIRNRIFHNESICWNIDYVKTIHDELTEVLGWMNKDLPNWLKQYDRFDSVSNEISETLRFGSSNATPVK